MWLWSQDGTVLHQLGSHQVGGPSREWGVHTWYPNPEHIAALTLCASPNWACEDFVGFSCSKDCRYFWWQWGLLGFFCLPFPCKGKSFLSLGQSGLGRWGLQKQRAS